MQVERYLMIFFFLMGISFGNCVESLTFGIDFGESLNRIDYNLAVSDKVGGCR